MDQLLEGHRRFRRNFWRLHGGRFADLARRGQSPSAMVVACCDSRVPPEVVFDCAPGEIFVVRSIANLIPPYAPDMANHGTSAALEYAVKELQVRDLVVLGHSRCGGIRALVQGAAGKPTDFVGIWMGIAAEAERRARAALHGHEDTEAVCRLCEKESIRVSLSNLTTFPWISSRLEAGMLRLHGLHFDMESGDLGEVPLSDRHPDRDRRAEEARRAALIAQNAATTDFGGIAPSDHPDRA
jgi:carbonic anhydrase